MNIRAPIAPKSPESFPNWTFEHIEIEYDAETQSVWMNYKADAPHCYTLRMLRNAIEFRGALQALFRSSHIDCWPIRYFVMSSNKPAVFSLGGDLETFAESIRRQDRETLLEYAYACIDVMYGLTVNFDLPIVSLTAVRGQCMGGGFEGALATDFLIAEESAKLGIPEIAFNTFPGMGAVSFLERRVGPSRAEQIISQGSVYSTRELAAMDLVTVVAPDEALRETVRNWMLDGETGSAEQKWRKRRALVQCRKRVFPLSREEMIKIVELWTDCSLAISEPDLRHMERLLVAQRRLGARRGNVS